MEPEADEDAVTREEVEESGEVAALGTYEICRTAGVGCSCSTTIDTVDPDADDDEDDTADIEDIDDCCDSGGEPPPLRGTPWMEESGEELEELNGSSYCCRAGGAGGGRTTADAVRATGGGAAWRIIVGGGGGETFVGVTLVVT